MYALDGSAGESYVVTQRSTDLDAYLLVADLDEVVLGEDDDSGVGDNGTDAEITIVFDTDDTALVIATSFAPGETGEYTLTAALQPAVQAAA
ncbi:MAG: hypothetical protein GTO61_00550, partial [Gemmatimonadales bacterium]|nr:hypothetical protein [Gemmatimonadales bacterium]